MTNFIYRVRHLLFGILLCVVGAFVFFSYSGVGASSLEHPEGISIREGSTRGPRGFFLFYGSRSRRGGGPLSGK